MQTIPVALTEPKKVRFFNPANGITLFRFFLTVILVALRCFGFANVVTFIITVIGGLTDVLDGIIARWFDCVTKLGGFLDKGTDKFFTSSQSGFIAYTLYLLYLIQVTFKGTMCLIILAFLVSLFIEELLLLSGGIWAYLKGLDVRSNRWGKRKMINECALLYFWSIINDLHPFGITLDSYFSLFVITFLVGRAYIMPEEALKAIGKFTLLMLRPIFECLLASLIHFSKLSCHKETVLGSPRFYRAPVFYLSNFHSTIFMLQYIHKKHEIKI